LTKRILWLSICKEVIAFLGLWIVLLLFGSRVITWNQGVEVAFDADWEHGNVSALLSSLVNKAGVK
jgi:hypothetical protein